jgi:predicted NBD/HSP70 family sugar kinase
VLTEILLNAPIARTELTQLTGLTAATISRICRDLVNAGLVKQKTSTEQLKRSGRRNIELMLNPDSGYFVGFGINAFVQWVSLYGLDNKVIAYEELSTDSLTDPNTVLEQLIEKAEQMIKASNISTEKIIGGGVAIAGIVEPLLGKLLFSPTLGWDELDIATIISSRLGCPICVETFANTLNLAETRFGIAKNCSNTILINTSLRIGASILLDNQIRRGTHFSAGLIGELPLQENIETLEATDNPQGRQLDDVAAGAAVIRQITGCQELINGRKAAVKLQQLKARSLQGDKEVSEAFRHAGRMLSNTISTVSNLLQPDVIILAGPMSSIPSYFKGVVENIQHSRTRCTPSTPIKVSNISGEQAVRLLTYYEFLSRRDIDFNRLTKVSI